MLRIRIQLTCIVVPFWSHKLLREKFWKKGGSQHHAHLGLLQVVEHIRLVVSVLFYQP